MTIKLQIYKCNICGNIVQILNPGDGNLICCGQEMEHLKIQYDNSELGEKHTPKYTFKENEKFVSVIGHPMTTEHYIQFIETYTRDKNEVHIKFFYPDELPEMNITFMPEANDTIEYCNIHKLWGNNVMLDNEKGDFSI